MPVTPTPPLTVADLQPFADLGTTVSAVGGVLTITRDTLAWQLQSHGPALRAKRSDGVTRTFSSPAALLASPDFADLNRWSENQKRLDRQSRSDGDLLPAVGHLRVGDEAGEVMDGVAALDSRLLDLRASMGEGTSLVLVVDGPAGIGKSTLMERLAMRRADSWGQPDAVPLVLHVESRGRVLQNIRDLLAYSLQTLRVSVTYDQVTPLVRHGLVTLVIDGFDELADPNGYETAWSQLNTIIEETRGRATLILAGRETFISRGRVQRALAGFNAAQDAMPLFSLQDISVVQAKEWLRGRGWAEADLAHPLVAPIFEPNSYALRPVFLTLVADLQTEIAKEALSAPDLLTILVQAMLEREATKFGEFNHTDMENFVRRVLEEVARDQAENQSSAVPKQTLKWIAELVGSEMFGEETIRVLANRIETLAFLARDVRADHVEFAHEQIAAHFLAGDCIRSVAAGEVPKYVRRNIFGREALDVLSRAAASTTTDEIDRFLEQCLEQFDRFGSTDRTKQNLVAFAVAAACASAAKGGEGMRFNTVGVNEMLVPADAPPLTFSDMTVNTLYAHGVDLSKIEWNDTQIVTLFADKRTVFGPKFPPPTAIERPDGAALRTPEAVQAWIKPQFTAVSSTQTSEDSVSSDVLDLLDRIDRYRSFWLRDEKDATDRSARRIVRDPDWPRIRDAMSDLGLLEMRAVSASGTSSKFYHFLQNQDPLRKHANLLGRLRD